MMALILGGSNERAVGAGRTLTDLARTVGDTRAWLQNCTLAPALSAARESALITTARERTRAAP